MRETTKPRCDGKMIGLGRVVRGQALREAVAGSRATRCVSQTMHCLPSQRILVIYWSQIDDSSSLLLGTDDYRYCTCYKEECHTK
jgi:hypothetical protein